MWMREARVNQPLITHRNSSDDIETGERLCPGNSMAATCLLAVWRPVYRRRDSHSGFRAELENLVGDGKGKVRKRGNARGAKGAGHLR
jgi:hypothetical protein